MQASSLLILTGLQPGDRGRMKVNRFNGFLAADVHCEYDCAASSAEAVSNPPNDSEVKPLKRLPDALPLGDGLKPRCG